MLWEPCKLSEQGLLGNEVPHLSEVNFLSSESEAGKVSLSDGAASLCGKFNNAAARGAQGTWLCF